MRAAVLIGLLWAVPASAQDTERRLHWPELGLLTAGAWDIGTTYRAWHDAQTHPGLAWFHERNPLINPLERFGPDVMLPAGAAMEVGGWWLADRLWSKDHPKVMRCAKVAGIAAHVVAGIGNFRDTNRLRREQSR